MLLISPNNLTVWVIPDIDMVRHKLLKLGYISSLLVVVIAFPFFFLGGSTEASSSFMRALWDFGHLIFFFATVLILSKKFDIKKWQVMIAISLAVFIFGGLIELVQAYIGRDGSWSDLLRDMTGTWLGLFWAQGANLWIWLGRLISFVLLLPNITTVFYEGRYQLNITQQFPLLAGFESSIETYGRPGIVERSSEFHTQGNYSLKVGLTTRKYTSIVFNRIINNWSGYKTFAFDMYNPDPQILLMTVRVNDAQHNLNGWVTQDRFNRSLVLNPGWNHFSFAIEDIRNAPAKREMDLLHITWVEIFAKNLPAPRSVYIDKVRLE